MPNPLDARLFASRHSGTLGLRRAPEISMEIPKNGGKYYDGRLTANEVLENWELNADLVTLSACESALGRPSPFAASVKSTDDVSESLP